VVRELEGLCQAPVPAVAQCAAAALQLLDDALQEQHNP